MSKLRRKSEAVPCKPLDAPRRETGGPLPTFFARQSSQTATSSSRPESSQPKRVPPLDDRRATLRSKAPATTKAKKKNAPPRSDQEIVVISSNTEATHISISSDTKSHISISSDSSVPTRQTRSSTLSKLRNCTETQAPSNTSNRSAAAATKATGTQPSTNLSSRHPPLPPMPVRLRARPILIPKPALKRPLTDSSDGEIEIDQVRVPRIPPVSSKGMFAATKPISLTSRNKTFLLKDNVSPSTAQNKSDRKPSPPKRARLASPDQPANQAPSSGNDADVEELVPSSQSDEQELLPSKVVKKNVRVVNENVDKWRKEALSGPSSRELCESLSDQKDLTLPDAGLAMDEDMLVETFSDTQPPGVSSSASEVDRLICQTSTSEAEISVDLRRQSSTSSLRDDAAPVAPSTSPNAVSTPPPSSPRSNRCSPSPDAPRTSISPQTSDPPALPATPIAMDVESRAAAIIAKIREQAYVEAMASSEEAPIELKELDDSSDESEDEFIAQIRANGKGRGDIVNPPVELKSERSSSPLTDINRRVSARYNLRPHSPSRRRTGSSNLPSFLVAQEPAAKRKPPRKVNPLDALLKEKELADKHGRGMDALRAAEAMVASSSTAKIDLRSEMDEEDLGSWADEEAALRVVQERARGLKLKSSSPLLADGEVESGGGSDSEEALIPQSQYAKALGELGEDNGMAVDKILAKDRGNPEWLRKGIQKVQVFGVPLWDDSLPTGEHADAMQVDGLPPLALKQEGIVDQPFIRCLCDAVREGDTSQVLLLLNSSLLVFLAPEQIATLIPWLIDLATSPIADSLREAAYHTLLYIPQCSTHPPRMPFSVVSDTLGPLGASATVMEASGWTTVRRPHVAVASAARAEAVYYIVSLTSAFARHHAIATEDVPDFLMAMLLLAMDPSTRNSLKRDIIGAVAFLGQILPHDASDTEVMICSKIVQFARDLSPLNQAYLLALLPRACPQTIRISRWVARCLLLKLEVPLEDCYNLLPPLSPIVDLLSPPPGSKALFDLYGNHDKDGYYDDLVYHLDVLSKVLAGVDEYVALEKEIARQEVPSALIEVTVDDSPSKRTKEILSPLEQVRNSLDVLHGKIVDTRAAHLDRSRAKAALQRLSLRVHYQRIASLRSSTGARRPQNLHEYFGQPRKT